MINRSECQRPKNRSHSLRHWVLLCSWSHWLSVHTRSRQGTCNIFTTKYIFPEFLFLWTASFTFVFERLTTVFVLFFSVGISTVRSEPRADCSPRTPPLWLWPWGIWYTDSLGTKMAAILINVLWLWKWHVQLDEKGKQGVVLRAALVG